MGSEPGTPADLRDDPGWWEHQLPLPQLMDVVLYELSDGEQHRAVVTQVRVDPPHASARHAWVQQLGHTTLLQMTSMSGEQRWQGRCHLACPQVDQLHTLLVARDDSWVVRGPLADCWVFKHPSGLRTSLDGYQLHEATPVVVASIAGALQRALQDGVATLVHVVITHGDQLVVRCQPVEAD